MSENVKEVLILSFKKQPKKNVDKSREKNQPFCFCSLFILLSPPVLSTSKAQIHHRSSRKQSQLTRRIAIHTQTYRHSYVPGKMYTNVDRHTERCTIAHKHICRQRLRHTAHRQFSNTVLSEHCSLTIVRFRPGYSLTVPFPDFFFWPPLYSFFVLEKKINEEKQNPAN